MLDRILKIIMALGAAGLIALIVLLIVGRSTGSRHAAAAPTATPIPTISAPPAPPATPAISGQSPLVRCAQDGKACRAALLTLINADRARASLPPLTLDIAQSDGASSEGAAGGCAGSQGHSRAMARTGRVWHRDAHHRHASYPNDICGTVLRSAENVGAGSGSEFAALRRIEHRFIRGSGPTSRHLLSRRFTRVGIGIARRGDRYYVTEDFIG